ncbi:hypothetical protein [Paenibacillus sp. FSL L8-0709]|uniref:hypothetical protein n=1 Tax=Paenibacillus sp. FSL L8-0709 TaxID=2975312 RepID=UPI0030F75D06
MTHTPRDWKKDMELCNEATPGKWSWYETTRSIYTEREDREALDTILYDPKGGGHLQEEDAEFIAEARTALPYWLQEAKERGVRERQLKEALELMVFMFRYDSEEGRAYMNFGDFEEVLEPDDNAAYISVSNLLRTLYPDTPAPTKEVSE